MQSKRSFSVGYVFSDNPHSLMHARTLEALPEVDVVHLCRLGQGNMEEVEGQTAKAATRTERLEELLRRDVDALMVSVRNDECPAVLDAAVDAGKPALFEKPGALTAGRLSPLQTPRGRRT